MKLCWHDCDKVPMLFFTHIPVDNDTDIFTFIRISFYVLTFLT